jgi:hypothetical protein
MTPKCPWCSRTFSTWRQAKAHVKNCDKSPRPRWKANLKRVTIKHD